MCLPQCFFFRFFSKILTKLSDSTALRKKRSELIPFVSPFVQLSYTSICRYRIFPTHFRQALSCAHISVSNLALRVPHRLCVVKGPSYWKGLRFVRWFLLRWQIVFGMMEYKEPIVNRTLKDKIICAFVLFLKRPY